MCEMIRHRPSASLPQPNQESEIVDIFGRLLAYRIVFVVRRETLAKKRKRARAASPVGAVESPSVDFPSVRG